MSCRYCGKEGHTAWKCFKKPRSPINKVGRQYKKWSATRTAWLLKNPPNTDGYYVCYLCNGLVHKDQITLDHIIPRSRRPDLRYKLSNLKPAHWKCNMDKGSKSLG